MEKIKEVLKGAFVHIGRVSLETIILVSLGIIFLQGFYQDFSNPVQLILLKALLVSAGVYHAHLIGKFFINAKVNWNTPIRLQSGAYLARVALYIIIPICYALGA